jgi:hypothetical protein
LRCAARAIIDLPGISGPSGLNAGAKGNLAKKMRRVAKFIAQKSKNGEKSPFSDEKMVEIF